MEDVGAEKPFGALDSDMEKKREIKQWFEECPHWLVHMHAQVCENIKMREIKIIYYTNGKKT